MDMDVDMDVPYNVSVFLTRRPVLEREVVAYISSPPAFTPNTDNSAAPTLALRMDVYANSIIVFWGTADTT